MRTTAPPLTWAMQNHEYLVRAFAVLQSRLRDEPVPPYDGQPSMDAPPAIDTLARIFGLSAFEREIVLLCAGTEMDSALAARCAEIGGRPTRGAVTFGLAMAVLRDPHWSAFTPFAPLRRFRLIELDDERGLTSAPLHLDERILHYLAGVNQLDARLERLVQPVSAPASMAEEHRRLVTESVASELGYGPLTAVVQFFGDDADGQAGVAASLASRGERELYVLRLEDAPAQGAEMEQFLQLWTREALLLPAVLLLQCDNEEPGPAAHHLAERLPVPLMIAAREPVRLHRRVHVYEVNKPGPAGQKHLWREALGERADDLPAAVDDVSEQFRLSAGAIASIGMSIRAFRGDQVAAGAQLWRESRAVSRPRLESLAERIAPHAGWDDLVLPEMQLRTLRQLAAQSRHRMTVYEEWGFAAKGRRGLGLSALFAGPSGTGKTLAAEVLANDLGLDLYRIDLSTVVSKYIGETNKNLKQVFDAAECGGVLLLFDEADALFGKRSEVKDSHDRYANMEVGYLLQRMEAYQGLAILTTNAKSALDKAFARRLRFIVDFPFPDTAERKAIWSRAFPAQTPTDDLQPELLAALNMTGGNIHNIAINAAFLAADSGVPVTMAHVLEATQLEAVKIERPLSERETRGWR
jgi:ATPase family associated with various cellular activities (AAA)